MKLVREHINEVIKHLTPKSIDQIKLTVDKLNPFQKFMFGCNEGLLWVVKEAVENDKINPGINDNMGLLHACQNGYPDIVQYLLSLPEVNPTEGGSVCLRSAVYYQNDEVVKILLKDGRGDPADYDLELIKDTAYNLANTQPTKKILDMLMGDKRFSTAYFKFIRSKRFKNHPNYRPDSGTYEM